MTKDSDKLRFKAFDRIPLNDACELIPGLIREASGILGYGHVFAIERTAVLLALIARIAAAGAARLRAEADCSRPILYDLDDPNQKRHGQERELEMVALNEELEALLRQATNVAGPQTSDQRAKLLEKALRQDGYI